MSDVTKMEETGPHGKVIVKEKLAKHAQRGKYVSPI